MITLEQLFTQLESMGGSTRKQILECGATHIAIDSHGSVYAYKGKPVHMTDFEEWQSGGEWWHKTCLWCGDLEPQENWRKLVFELP